jgi:hypothetical protein
MAVSSHRAIGLVAGAKTAEEKTYSILIASGFLYIELSSRFVPLEGNVKISVSPDDLQP